MNLQLDSSMTLTEKGKKLHSLIADREKKNFNFTSSEVRRVLCSLHRNTLFYLEDSLHSLEQITHHS